MLALGTSAPDFTLPDVARERPVSLGALRDGRPLLVMFISRHCPYVVHVAGELARIGADYGERVSIVAIGSNDVVAYPDDAPDRLAAMAREQGFRFPVLYDATQEVAKAYAAACTPDFFLFDADGRLAYRGQLDDSRPKNGRPVTGRDLRRALDAVLAGAAVAGDQWPSMGCNIKWRPGNEPSYYGGRPNPA
jgi:peroxiredoxin